MKTKIGGQAVLEGVMMRGATSMALCVRDENGTIRTDTQRLSTKKPWYKKIPIVRGVANLITSLVSGMKTTMKSAEVAIEEDVQASDKGVDGFMTVAIILGVGLAVFLFTVLPTLLTNLLLNLCGWQEIQWIRSLSEGILKVAILIVYMWSISFMGEINRVFMYHGAEHKTIACYEAELPLTVENVRKCSRFHDRCGTSFLVFVVLLSIVVSVAIDAICYAVCFDLISVWYVRLPIKLATIPLLAGLSYEMIMLLANTEFILFRPLKWAGKQFQRITTREPDDDMIEVAICAFNKVLEMDADQSVEEEHFPGPIALHEFKKQLTPLLNYNNMERCDLDWILSAVLGVERSNLKDDLMIPFGWQVRAENYVKRCANGEPLQQVLGNTDFYGKVFCVTKDTLIPRFETELVCEQAIKLTTKESKVLDLCCGTGCIGITINLFTQAKVVCADVSAQALKVAKFNAKKNKANVSFVKSDMFQNVKGKFDVVVCNPPYIATDVIETLDDKVKNYEPKLALDGGKDGLDFYRILAHNIKDHLTDKGVLVLEIGYDQGEAVKQLFQPIFKEVEVKKDYSQNDRIVICK